MSFDNTKSNLYYCKNCDSDPFTKIQKCSNFSKTLEKFHTDQGHEIISYTYEPSIRELFTQKLNDSMPQSIEELKKSLRNYTSYDIDKKQTIDSDNDEFQRNTKGGFYAYEQKNTSQHFAKDFVSDVMLPAHVYDGKESCGMWKLGGCLESDMHENKGGYIKKGIMRCNYKGCRKCATNSIIREAKAITNRLMTFCNLKNNRKIYLKKNRSRILLHVIVSIPYEEHSLYLAKHGRKKLRIKTLKYLKDFDIDGGVIIDHPYRFSENLESARFSPHLHCIVTGWLDGNMAKQLYEKTGWIISNVSNMETWKDCYLLSKYLLSHSAVFMKEEGKRSAEHSVRYFGECHNKKFKVESVLEHSITGIEQIDHILYTRKEIERKDVIYKLQKVSYTHSIIHETIKDVTNEYFECYPNGKVLELSKILRQYITPYHKDNPAFPQSEHLEDDISSMKFLQMRFDYGVSIYDIVQSVYVNVIFDTSLDELCPECSLKMQSIVPPSTELSERQQEIIADMLVDMPEDIPFPIDDVTQFDYMSNVGVSILGIPYYTFDGMLHHDTGIYSLPEAINWFSVKLCQTIIKNINTQKAKYLFKINHGRTPTLDELKDVIKLKKFHTTYKTESIQNYMENDNE